MEEFKKKIKQRIIIFTGMALVAVVFGIYDSFVISNSKESSMAAGMVAGFQSGIILGMGILSLIQIIRLRKSITDETKLKKLYNQEHDERLKTIRSKAGMPMLMIASIVMLIAAIIAGYTNITIFYTLVIAAIAQLSIGAIVKIYCFKTM
jgi:hypothetical protein